MGNEKKESFSWSSLREMAKNTSRVFVFIRTTSWGLFFILIVLSLFFSVYGTIFSGARSWFVNELTGSVGFGSISNSLLYSAILVLCLPVVNYFAWALIVYFRSNFYTLISQKRESLVLEKIGTLDLESLEDPDNKNLIRKIESSYRLRSFIERNFDIFGNFISLLSAGLF